MAALTSAPERPVELQAFPALQELRLEGVPLEYFQGTSTAVKGRCQS